MITPPVDWTRDLELILAEANDCHGWRIFTGGCLRHLTTVEVIRKKRISIERDVLSTRDNDVILPRKLP